MRLLNICVTILIFLVSSLEAQQKVKVLSYNIEGMKPGTSYQGRLQAIIQELKLIDPDLLGLQEVAQHSPEDNMAQIIADSLSNHFGTKYHVYWQATHMAYSSYTEGLAIISRWPVNASGFKALPLAVFPRKVLWNQIDINGFTVHFFTAHLAYRQEDSDTRVKQVNMVKSFIEAKMAGVPGFAILTGDFNCTPDSKPIEQLSTYTSGWDHLHPTLPGHTFSASKPSRKIDYIFTGPDQDVQLIESSLVFNSTYDGKKHPSDHLGLLLTIDLGLSQE